MDGSMVDEQDRKVTKIIEKKKLFFYSKMFGEHDQNEIKTILNF